MVIFLPSAPHTILTSLQVLQTLARSWIVCHVPLNIYGFYLVQVNPSIIESVLQQWSRSFSNRVYSFTPTIAIHSLAWPDPSRSRKRVTRGRRKINLSLGTTLSHFLTCTKYSASPIRVFPQRSRYSVIRFLLREGSGHARLSHTRHLTTPTGHAQKCSQQSRLVYKTHLLHSSPQTVTSGGQWH